MISTFSKLLPKSRGANAPLAPSPPVAHAPIVVIKVSKMRLLSRCRLVYFKKDLVFLTIGNPSSRILAGIYMIHSFPISSLTKPGFAAPLSRSISLSLSVCMSVSLSVSSSASLWHSDLHLDLTETSSDALQPLSIYAFEMNFDLKYINYTLTKFEVYVYH